MNYTASKAIPGLSPDFSPKANPPAPGVLYSNRAGVASPNISAPGMQSGVNDWLKNRRPSGQTLLNQGEAVTPKASGMNRASTLLDDGAQAVKAGMKRAANSTMGAQGLPPAQPIPAATATAPSLSATPGVQVSELSKGISRAVDGAWTGAKGAFKGGMRLLNPTTPGGLMVLGEQEQMQLNTNRYNEDKLVKSIEHPRIGMAGVSVIDPKKLTAEQHSKLDAGVNLNTPEERQAHYQTMLDASTPALNPASVKPQQLDKNDPNNPINRALALASAHQALPGADIRAVGGLGMIRANKAPGFNSPLYSDNPSNPTAGMPLKGGGLSTIGIDKTAIERGIAAERDLHAARIEAMDGRPPVEGGRFVTIGDPDAAAKENRARFASDLRLQATSPLSSKPKRTAALGMLAHMDGTDASISNAQTQADSQQQLGILNNRSTLQREQMEQAAKAPGMQLDNAGKLAGLQEQGQLAKLRSDYMALNDTNDASGAKRKQLGAQLMTLQGKSAGQENKFKVVELGGGNDANGQPLPKTGYVFNQETGQYTPMAGASQGKTVSKADYAELVKRYATQGINEESVKKLLADKGYQVGA